MGWRMLFVEGCEMAKVLVVDDSATYRLRLRLMLVKLGHKVVTAGDGAEALELARSEQPDVVLMDVVMPGMNGFEATRALGRDSATRGIPVIFVTSMADEVDRVWGMRQGAAAYVTKPVNPNELKSAITDAIVS
jgi:twitching motility two-component system response regulator PilH